MARGRWIHERQDMDKDLVKSSGIQSAIHVDERSELSTRRAKAKRTGRRIGMSLDARHTRTDRHGSSEQSEKSRAGRDETWWSAGPGVFSLRKLAAE